MWSHLILDLLIQLNYPFSLILSPSKLIGARYYNKGYEAIVGHKLNSSYQSPRDTMGHGSHTLSTAGGNFVPGASVFGIGNGTAKGGSPKARVASYKVCWPPVDDGSECFDADIVKGFEAAISDGVDVLSVSLGGGHSIDYFRDGIAISSFHAVKSGVVVVASAGNSGPTPGTVSNVAPWIITVGATTLDRSFQANVVLKNGSVFNVSFCLISLKIMFFFFFYLFTTCNNRGRAFRLGCRVTSCILLLALLVLLLQM